MEIKMTTTDTPQTDAVQFQKKPISLSIENEMLRALSRKIERELTASKAEVKEIRSALGDDGRRTHKELLEMAFKASGWKTWKEKYIDLKNAHIAEGQDPAGTIWEHADKLQKELKEAKAEVERLRSTMRSFIDFMDENLGTTADWLKELIYDDKETCQRGCDHINAMKRLVKPEDIN